MFSTIQKFFTVMMVCSVFASCGDAATDKPAEGTDEMPAATKAETKKFEGVQFASNKDTICGMPLTAGVEDTMIVDGKVYGFCATGCKEEFAKVLGEGKK